MASKLIKSSYHVPTCTCIHCPCTCAPFCAVVQHAFLPPATIPTCCCHAIVAPHALLVSLPTMPLPSHQHFLPSFLTFSLQPHHLFYITFCLLAFMYYLCTLPYQPTTVLLAVPWEEEEARQPRQQHTQGGISARRRKCGRNVMISSLWQVTQQRKTARRRKQHSQPASTNSSCATGGHRIIVWYLPIYTILCRPIRLLLIPVGRTLFHNDILSDAPDHALLPAAIYSYFLPLAQALRARADGRIRAPRRKPNFDLQTSNIS